MLAALVSLALVGCQTSEVKNELPGGLSDDIPAGSVQSHYGSGHGDSIGGGGAGAPIDAEHPASTGGTK